MILFLDFEKAFDSVNWTFMFSVLEKFNFGEYFRKWIKILYTNISSCIINNGRTGGYFSVERGVRQGDPLSPYLFTLAAEFLATRIRENNSIKGIYIKGHEMKLTMFADDISVFLPDEASAINLFATLREFLQVSGLKINLTKTEGLWIGKDCGSNKTPFHIKWPKCPIKVLGIYISCNTKDAAQKNFEDKLKKLQMQLHWWKARKLSLKGRTLIIKSLGLANFNFLASVIYIPQDIIKKVNQLIFHFLWNGACDKVKRDIMIQSYENGGYEMTN